MVLFTLKFLGVWILFIDILVTGKLAVHTDSSPFRTISLTIMLGSFSWKTVLLLDIQSEGFGSVFPRRAACSLFMLNKNNPINDKTNWLPHYFTIWAAIVVYLHVIPLQNFQKLSSHKNNTPVFSDGANYDWIPVVSNVNVKFNRHTAVMLGLLTFPFKWYNDLKTLS